jgi:ATP-binding cassette subfamily F protein 3
MRHALTRALAEYEGSLILVSHDRSLLRTVCDGFLLVADGTAREFDGDVDDYLAWLMQRRSAAAPPAPHAVDAGNGTDRASRRTQHESARVARQERLARRRPVAREAERLEREVAALDAEKRALEARLADPAFYATDDFATVQSATRRCAQVAGLLEVAEARWLELQAELEAIGEP